jgi:hypothetical protein
MLCTTYNFMIWGRTLKHSETVHSSDMYINVYQPTYCHIPEDIYLHRISNLINHLAFRQDLTKYLLLNKQQVQNTTGVGRLIINPPPAWLLERNFVHKIPRGKKGNLPHTNGVCSFQDVTRPPVSWLQCFDTCFMLFLQNWNSRSLDLEKKWREL